MHKIAISQSLLDRVHAQRGNAPSLLDRLDPARTANVVIDMQNGFTAPDSAIEVPVAREIIPNVNAISAALRAAGGSNVFLRFTYLADEPQRWTSYYGSYHGPEMEEMTRAHFGPGAEGHGLAPALELGPEDLVLDKTRYSGFVPGTCALEEVLKERGIDTLIITGTLTNCCCESTARDAMQRGYNVLFISDGTAALTDEEHNASLISMTTIFTEVVTTEELLNALGRTVQG